MSQSNGMAGNWRRAHEGGADHAAEALQSDDAVRTAAKMPLPSAEEGRES